MNAKVNQQFEARLSAVGVTTDRVSNEEAPETIADTISTPAVGTSLDNAGISLSETPVTVDPTPKQLQAATTGVTPAAFAIADYGSLVLPSSTGSELVSLFVDRHVVVLSEGHIVPDMETAFERFGNEIPDEYSDAIIATGPSATADMGDLVRGAHGPSEVHLLILED